MKGAEKSGTMREEGVEREGECLTPKERQRLRVRES